MSERGQRLWRFVVDRFPPAIYVPAGIASFLSLYLALQALGLGGGATLTVSWRALAGALTVVLFLFLMRVYDELKDVDTDIQLGKAGDPRYKDRPIVLGTVKVTDIVLLRWWVTVILFALNLALGWPLPLLVFLLLFALGWLSFKWFFWPAISGNLLLALVTHNPILLVLGIYVAALYSAEFGIETLGPWTLALLVGLWVPFAAWETSRKIRIPQDETAYQTYSMLLGWRNAVLLPLGFTLFSVACLVPVALAAKLGSGFILVLVTAAGIMVWRCLLFRLAPTRERARLQPYAEMYLLVANLGLVVALVLHYGIGFAAGD